MPRRLVLFVLFAVSVTVLTPARASCFPQIQISQIASGNYHYVVFPGNSAATTQSIVGRFWQPGNYGGTNQGACDETQWLVPCGADCAPHGPTPVFYVDGFLGTMACNSGCPDGEVILLLEDRGSSGGLFFAARVDETPGPLFDFSRLNRDLVPVPIPRPRVQSWTQGTATVQLDDPAPGFFALPGTPASGTITAFHVLKWSGVGSPPAQRAGWTSLARFPYAGGATTGGVAVGDSCPPNGADVYLGAALELDGGVLTDYVSFQSVSTCIPERWLGGGHVPEAGAEGLHLSRAAAGDLTLNWSPSCVASNGAAIYQGVLGDWTSHVPRDCAVVGTTASFQEPATSVYFLVVPQSANLLPPDVEGSYGLLRDGSERPPGAQACLQQAVVDCP